MKLRTKINLYTSAVFLLLFALVAAAIYFTYSSMMLDHELDLSAAEAVKTAEGFRKMNENVDSEDVLSAYMPLDSMMKIVDSDGKSSTTVTSPDQQALTQMPVAYHKAEKRGIIKCGQFSCAFISIPIIKMDGDVANLQLTKSLEGTDHILRTLRTVLLSITLLATVPVLISSRLLSNFISRPILNMIRTMTEIRKSGQYNRIPLEKQSNDELYKMGDTFNEMIDQLERNYESQEQFVMSASHELKTPLTIIESYSSLLKRRGLEKPELFEESVDAIHSEAIRMRELTEQLLLLAKHENQSGIELQKVNLGKAAKEAIRSFHMAFNREISLAAEVPAIVHTDRHKLKQLIYILMENACKYSEGPIIVRVGEIEEKGLLEVIDSGIGIPAADLPKLFDRFYRVDKARTRKTGGFGLGLSIAKEIALAIGADVELESKEGEGTTARIVFETRASN